MFCSQCLTACLCFAETDGCGSVEWPAIGAVVVKGLPPHASLYRVQVLDWQTQEMSEVPSAEVYITAAV